jgi:branched-chain amino acid transport system permease protein
VATELVGINVRRLSSFTWGLAAVLGGLGGVLTAPIAGGFGPGFLTTNALIPGFTAAVLGGMTSLPGAFVGGVVVGVAQSLAVSSPALSGIPGAGSVMVFVLLIAILAVRPQGLLGKTAGA